MGLHVRAEFDEPASSTDDEARLSTAVDGFTGPPTTFSGKRVAVQSPITSTRHGAAVRQERTAAPPFPRHTATVSPRSPSAPFVQVFGLDGHQGTRAAQRFFKERRIAISYVDLRRRTLAPAELRRFVDRLGAPALIDADSRAYKDAGLAWMRLGDAEILERITANPALLRLPLVRFDNEVSAGRDEATWKSWVKPRGA
jgi:arsenate reductase